ncbi:MAG: type II methionyl aminopeptidase [Candidatus Bathyarchaeota archaeon]|nr:type II methionyl aminopeptidase [Candidatus Bathyarchaeota archaeon]
MAIPEETFQKYVKAGRIAAKVREQMQRTVSEGMRIIDICEKAESLIRESRGKPAFPCNVSINEVAAHYTSSPQDKKAIPESSIVKVDIGVHVDGYIADTAVTVCFNPEYENLVRAAEEALETAIKMLRPGLSISRFGSAVQKSIKMHGLKPISNLTGHQISRYSLHAGKALPNVFHLSTSRVKAGEIYAVEPFVTMPNAAGKVRRAKEAHIFRFIKHKSLKNEYSKRLLNYIEKNFRTLPFSERWLEGCVPTSHHSAAFSELLSSKTLMSYPVFIEASGKPVAQAEHTVIITKDGCHVST